MKNIAAIMPIYIPAITANVPTSVLLILFYLLMVSFCLTLHIARNEIFAMRFAVTRYIFLAAVCGVHIARMPPPRRATRVLPRRLQTTIAAN
jgi:hypothetical protein